MKRLSVFVIIALTTASSAEAAGNGLHKHHRVPAVHKSLVIETSPGPAVKRLPIPADTFRA